MNVFNPKPLTWCIYRFCTGVSNTGVNMIFKTFFFFFKSRDIPQRRKSLLASDLKTAYGDLIFWHWYRCWILIDLSRGSALERMEVSCFISLCWLLEAAMLSSHRENYWDLKEDAEIHKTEHLWKGLDLVSLKLISFLKMEMNRTTN